MTATAVGAITAVLFDWDGTLIDSRAALLAAWHESTEAVIGHRFPATAAEERLQGDPGTGPRQAQEVLCSVARDRRFGLAIGCRG